MTPATVADHLVVPELGPSLGRLCDPPAHLAAAGPVPLDDIRFALVTGIFDLAGAARAFAAGGDRQGAVTSLGRIAWLNRWERAVDAAAERITETVNRRLEAAAAESRVGVRRLSRRRLTADDTRAISARLGSGGGGFVTALDALELTVPRAASGDVAAWRQWQEALLAAGRRLESAWLALEAAAAREGEHWEREVAAVRAWRRPTWPLWLATLLLLAAATYLGLVLGGYLPVPPPLEGLARFWWERL